MVTNPLFDQIILKLRETHPGFRSLMELVGQLPEDNFFISGGVVRDILSGNNNRIKDIDIFLSSAGFDKVHDFMMANGELVKNQFGSGRWFPGDAPGFYYDIILIPRFYNGLWPCRNITDVLNQFDITANAVAFDLLTGRFFNPQNGLDDIKNNVLRAVRFDFPELLVSNEVDISRITVLWFRYHYYAAKLNFNIEPITRKWLDDNSFRLNDLEKFKYHFFDPQLAL
jgi:hypothetical protein